MNRPMPDADAQLEAALAEVAALLALLAECRPHVEFGREVAEREKEPQ